MRFGLTHRAADGLTLKSLHDAHRGFHQKLQLDFAIKHHLVFKLIEINHGAEADSGKGQPQHQPDAGHDADSGQYRFMLHHVPLITVSLNHR